MKSRNLACLDTLFYVVVEDYEVQEPGMFRCLVL